MCKSPPVLVAKVTIDLNDLQWAKRTAKSALLKVEATLKYNSDDIARDDTSGLEFWS